MVKGDRARNVHWHSLIGSILKVMNDATHNEDECKSHGTCFPGFRQISI